MKLHQTSPTVLTIDKLSVERLSELKNSLSYTDQKLQFELQRFKKNRWLPEKMGIEAYNEKLAEMKSKLKVCLLKETDTGYECLSGLTRYIETKYGVTHTSSVKMPTEKLLAWNKPPEFQPYPYQLEAVEALLKASSSGLPCRVDLATGLGKSFLITLLVKRLGLKTVIMAPSQSIADQLFTEMTIRFGRKKVGAFFDGKKDYRKQIVVGTGASLTRVKPDSVIGKEFSGVQVFMADESHQCPAATLANVCTGVLANAPYRFFFSATQIRNDGADLLLDAITGETVYRMSLQEGVDQGYLAKPVFSMVEIESHIAFESHDANEMTREHLYYNPRVLAAAANLINMSVELLGHQVLVLIDEVEQFASLYPHLKHKAMFAHGPLQKDNIEKVPPEHREVDNAKLVASFNRCEFPILVGTSAISTGTDIKSVKTMVYLKGGKSEIEVTQGVGRCTRLLPAIGKTACNVIDFDVVNVPTLHRHAEMREQIYNGLYPTCQRISL